MKQSMSFQKTCTVVHVYNNKYNRTREQVWSHFCQYIKHALRRSLTLKQVSECPFLFHTYGLTLFGSLADSSKISLGTEVVCSILDILTTLVFVMELALGMHLQGNILLASFLKSLAIIQYRTGFHNTCDLATSAMLRDSIGSRLSGLPQAT